jgi:glycosyltransferase involved in cell wall biosynthesis
MPPVIASGSEHDVSRQRPGTSSANVTGMTKRPAIVVASDIFGQSGGAGRVTALACEAFSRLGADVTCFATWIEPGTETRELPFRIIPPMIRKGSRWDIPNRILAMQATRMIVRGSPVAAISVGLTKLCGHLLSGPAASRLQVWELTNANPGNKFVDASAARLLRRALAVLSPAAVIDASVRLTYGYTGTIRRVPFWIEDTPSSGDEHRTYESDFLFLARRENDKGLPELIKAAALVGGRFPGVRIRIGGPGSEAPFQSIARETGASPFLEFVNLPSRSDAMLALRKTRFLVLPSHHEGYPLSLLEAAREGVPFITTSVGCISDVFGDSSACHIVEPRNVDSLAGAMLDFLAEPPATLISRQRAARERFSQLSSRQSVERMLQETFLTAPPTPC